MKKRQLRGLGGALLVGLLTVLLAGGYIFYARWQHDLARAAVRGGQYDLAAGYARRDLLFSREEKTLIEIRGLLDAKDYDRAEARLASVPDSAPARALREELIAARDRICLEKAWSLLNDGQLDLAARQISRLIRPGETDLTDFYEKLHRDRGDRQLSARYYDGALSEYRQCAQLPPDGEILAALEARDYVAAARLAIEADAAGASLLTEDEWLRVLLRCRDELSPSQVEQYLQVEAALSRFRADDRSETLSERMLRQYSGWWWPGSMDKVGVLKGGRLLGLTPSAEALLSRCGSAPAGKILVLYDQLSYPDQITSCVVDYDMMELLPADRMPAGLDEVEYVIRVSCGYLYLGNFTIVREGTGESWPATALQITAEVCCLHMPEGDVLYRSGVLRGDTEMDVFISRNDWISGGEPPLDQVLADALSHIS